MTMVVDAEYEPWEREIIELEKKHGEVTPQMVLWAAQLKRSALHEHFNWNDEEAANEFRLRQARTLISKVKVKVITPDEDEVEQPRYVPVRVAANEERDAGTVMRPVSAVVDDTAARKQLVSAAVRALLVLRRRYQIVHELAGVFREIDALAQKERGGAQRG
jgi:hypothetical protein